MKRIVQINVRRLYRLDADGDLHGTEAEVKVAGCIREPED